jgi:hypothetical protein
MKFRFVITSSINTPEREQKYLEQIRRSLAAVTPYPFSVYIVENNGPRPTAFDTIENVNLFYTHTNSNRAFEKKGMKEFHDLLLLADKYDFKDDDMIIKLTGLYTLEDPNSFLNTVVQNELYFDAFIKWMDVIQEKYYYDDCCLGLYAIRFKYLKEFNYIEMATHYSMEQVFAKYVRNIVPAARISSIEHLGLWREGNTQLV